jgi:hypothetical protein
MVQVNSTETPFTSTKVAAQAITTLGRADAMGLLPRDGRIEALDFPTLQIVVRYIHRAGIGRTIQLRLEDDPADRGAGMEQALRNLNAALEESPSPEFEWTRMLEILGLDLLAELLGASVSSVRRYSAAARTTPDEVAGRLHFLSLLVGDLSGAYNEIGVRQWFHRTRTQLDGRAPSDLLKRRWLSGQEGPSKVRDLARALTASPAT